MATTTITISASAEYSDGALVWPTGEASSSHCGNRSSAPRYSEMTTKVTASQPIQVVVSQLAPLLLRPALELLPIPFNLIPIHDAPPFVSELERRSKKETVAISTVVARSVARC